MAAYTELLSAYTAVQMLAASCIALLSTLDHGRKVAALDSSQTDESTEELQHFDHLSSLPSLWYTLLRAC